MTKNNNKNSSIDLEFLKSIVEDDIEFKKELFSIFSDSSKKNLDKMEESLKSNDYNSWYMASHAFKGASASIGAFDLSKALEYAQKGTESGNEEKLSLLNQVKQEFELVLDFIKNEMVLK